MMCIDCSQTKTRRAYFARFDYSGAKFLPVVATKIYVAIPASIVIRLKVLQCRVFLKKKTLQKEKEHDSPIRAQYLFLLLGMRELYAQCDALFLGAGFSILLALQGRLLAQ